MTWTDTYGNDFRAMTRRIEMDRDLGNGGAVAARRMQSRARRVPLSTCSHLRSPHDDREDQPRPANAQRGARVGDRRHRGRINEINADVFRSLTMESSSILGDDPLTRNRDEVRKTIETEMIERL